MCISISRSDLLLGTAKRDEKSHTASQISFAATLVLRRKSDAWRQSAVAIAVVTIVDAVQRRIVPAQSEPANAALATASSDEPLMPSTDSPIDHLSAKAQAKCNSMSPLIKCQSPQQRKGAADSSPSLRTRSRSSFQRPSLSDQLKTISQAVFSFYAQLAVTEEPRTPADHDDRMAVGKLECRFPCPVRFAQDHCSYLFQHPYEAKEFRINNPLEQFGDDYKPENPQHAIKIVLATISEAQKVKQFINDHKLWFPR
ncbi:hypothetical protein FI667_g9055, partial [Globisporangium splendens]